MSWSNILEQLATAAIPMIIETVGDFLKKLSTVSPMTENSSVGDVEKISDSVSILREQVLKQGRKTIDAANDYVVDYVNEQLFELESNAELFKKYQISSHSVKRQLREIKNQLEDFWQDAIYKKISLDNRQCRALLKMSTGAEKEHEIEKFIQAVLDSSLDEYITGITEALGNLYVDLEKDISNSVALLEKTVQDYTKLLNAVDESNEQKYEQLLADAQTKIFCCEMILSKTEG